MAYSDAFIPVVDSGTNLSTATQKTSANTTANIALGCQEFLIKCHTYPVYIRIGPASVTVSATNGFYLAANETLRLQASKAATHLAVINVTTDEHGVISVQPGTAE